MQTSLLHNTLLYVVTLLLPALQTLRSPLFALAPKLLRTDRTIPGSVGLALKSNT